VCGESSEKGAEVGRKDRKRRMKYERICEVDDAEQTLYVLVV
jgi:hypothetical protein